MIIHKFINKTNAQCYRQTLYLNSLRKTTVNINLLMNTHTKKNQKYDWQIIKNGSHIPNRNFMKEPVNNR